MGIPQSDPIPQPSNAGDRRPPTYSSPHLREKCVLDVDLEEVVGVLRSKCRLEIRWVDTLLQNGA